MKKGMYNDLLFKILLVAIGFALGMLVSMIIVRLQYGFWV